MDGWMDGWMDGPAGLMCELRLLSRFDLEATDQFHARHYFMGGLDYAEIQYNYMTSNCH